MSHELDEMCEEERWMDLRDRMGRLWGRYNPQEEMLEFRRGPVLVRFELGRLQAQFVESTRHARTDVLE